MATDIWGGHGNRPKWAGSTLEAPSQAVQPLSTHRRTHRAFRMPGDSQRHPLRHPVFHPVPGQPLKRGRPLLDVLYLEHLEK